MTFEVAVSNQKGGIGKTTVAVNTAGALANHGHDVLLVDLDPQGYATESVGLEDTFDEDGLTLHDVLLDLDDIERGDELIREAPEFDVIPSNIALSSNNTKNNLQNAQGGERRVSMMVDHLTFAYDFLLIDCPPGLNVFTDNALIAAGHVLIPAETKGTSKRAVELLRDQIDSLELLFPNVSIQPVGVVANEVREDNVSDEMLEWFDTVFGDVVPVYQLRKRVALQRAQMAGRSIFEHDEECDMEAVFDEIAADLERRAET